MSLSTENHKWPVRFVAAVSKVLEDAGIPHFIWGDLLNWWRGNPHVPRVCGCVVAASDVEAATAAIVRAGLPFCTCRSRVHQADPGTSGTLPVHFPVKNCIGADIIFLTGNDRLLDLIPLTPDHPNPADLQYDRFAVPHRDPANSDRQVVNVLTTTSLVKVFLLLYAFLIYRGTGGYTFRHLLFIMAANTPKDSIDLSSPALQQLWNHITTIGIADDRHLRECVEEEWEHRLSPSKFNIEPQRLVAPVWGSDKGMEGLPSFEECGLEKVAR
ncbi:hypothetical protein ARMGADRAFT_1165272 [Armillaria gallica]|uniref:Uncharacterized protein n=1 Tax=Armillaria gallica TaxID=47427 RepID=A0A2H3DCK3_ARMGA|nr:hypothetical protein ARMGADRAFT_1165272 [Armillaria gallica]